MTVPEINGGHVDLELDGKPCRLVPSLEACLEISAMGDGLRVADERVRQLSFDAMLTVIGAGLEIDGERLNPRQRKELLPKAIYEAGVFSIMAKCVEFIMIVGNGGRKLPDLDEDEPEGEDDERPLA